MPLRLLLHVPAGLVLPLVRGGDADIANRIAAGQETRFRIGTQIADDAARQFARMLLARFSARGTAFPSSHVSITVVQTAILWRWQRPVAPLAACLSIGLAGGAVYGGFHYLTDVLAGIALGSLVAWLVVFRAPGLPMRWRTGLLALAALGITGCASAAPSHRFYSALPYGVRVGLSAPFGLGLGYGQSNTASGAGR